MQRIEEIDICKGLAILFVYLGHSILYYPYVETIHNSIWCQYLDKCIISFNMPLFFVISGLLFYGTKKTTVQILKNKTIRLAIPYLVCMTIVILAKQLLPGGMAYNKQSGIINILWNIFLGGDRWFVYVLFFIFIIIALLKKVFTIKIIYLLMAISIILSMLDFLPNICLLNTIIYFLFFFLLGCIYKNNYKKVNSILVKYWYCFYGLFILCNIIFVEEIMPIPIIGNYIIQITGIATCFLVSFHIVKFKEAKCNKDNKIIRYIEYSGKYSLQFYLMSFAYPLIRTIVVNVLYFTNPFLILSVVFVLQLICITIIIEITRRIKFLKVPLGY